MKWASPKAHNKQPRPGIPLKRAIPSALTVVALSLLGSLPARASWLYVDHFPWVWNSGTGWSFWPVGSEVVWNQNMASWILNPYGDPVDMEVVAAQETWKLRLENGGSWKDYGDGERADWDTYEALTTDWLFYLSRKDTASSFILFADNVYDSHYILDFTSSINQLDGTILMHLKSTSDQWTANFALLLDFQNMDGGTYRLVGNMRLFSKSETAPMVINGTFQLN